MSFKKIYILDLHGQISERSGWSFLYNVQYNMNMFNLLYNLISLIDN